MKKYEITKEQILRLHEHGTTIVKDWFPEAFKQELEVGKWYVSEKPNGSVFEYIGYKKARGFFQGNDWTDSWCWPTTNDLREATESEVSVLLEKEAIRRGFVNGVSFNILNGEREAIHNYNNARYGYDAYCNKLLMNGWCIFEKGVWAKPIASISKKEAEKQLGMKIIG